MARTSKVYGQEVGIGRPAIPIEFRETGGGGFEIRLLCRITDSRCAFRDIMSKFQREAKYDLEERITDETGRTITLFPSGFAFGPPLAEELEQTFALILVASLGRSVHVQRVGA